MVKCILSDCDYVILNINNPFATYLHQTTGMDFSAHNETLPTFMWPYFQQNPSHLIELAKGFQVSPLFTKGKAVQGAVCALHKLKEHGYTLHVISSAIADESQKEKTIESRRQNLLNVFGSIFNDIHILSWAQDKSSVLKRYPQNSYYVEDSITHALEALKIGHKPILLQTYHTKELHESTEQNIPVFKSWDKIVTYILKTDSHCD